MQAYAIAAQQATEAESEIEIEGAQAAAEAEAELAIAAQQAAEYAAEAGDSLGVWAGQLATLAGDELTAAEQEAGDAAASAERATTADGGAARAGDDADPVGAMLKQASSTLSSFMSPSRAEPAAANSASRSDAKKRSLSPASARRFSEQANRVHVVVHDDSPRAARLTGTSSARAAPAPVAPAASARAAPTVVATRTAAAVAVDAGGVSAPPEGWIVKQVPHVYARDERRWFAIDRAAAPTTLRYYTDESKAKEHGAIDLTACTIQDHQVRPEQDLRTIPATERISRSTAATARPPPLPSITRRAHALRPC